MPRQLELTADQTLASQRHDLRGAIYVLSGTLPGRAAGVADLAFRWSTLTFSGALGDCEAYILKPRDIERGQQFLPGDGSSNRPAHVPLRNLPLGDSPSAVAAIDDGKYSWENATVSLRVGYLKPGQDAEDLAEADWTFLIKEGFFGAPQDVSVDGMVLPVFSRGAKRNQVFRQPLMPTANEVGACDKKFLGSPLPLLIGKPNGWIRVPGADLGVRGFLVSGYDAGATQVTFQLITDGQDRLNRTTEPSDIFFTANEIHAGKAISGNVLMIHRRLPLYQIKGAETVYSQASGTVTVTLESGLAADVPRGGFVQEHKSFAYGDDEGGPGPTLWRDRAFTWILTGGRGFHTVAQDGSPDGWSDDLKGNMGWLFPDGSIKAAGDDEYGWVIETVSETDRSPLRSITRLKLQQVSTSGAYNDPRIPVYFDPNVAGDVSIVDQPQFTSTERADSILNYPTGGTGTDNANARDGSEETAASLGVGDEITLTFNSAPSPFADDDTTASVLHVVTQGNIDFKNNAETVTFGSSNGAGGTNRAFRFTQGTARDFDETVKCVGAGGSGGSVVEVWWEHSLSKTVTNTRTQDVTLNTAGEVSGLGEVMQYADLVMRVPSTKGNVAGKMRDDTLLGDFDDTWRVEDTEDTNSEIGNASGNVGSASADKHNKYVIPLPTSVMATLQSWFLGPTEGAPGLINSGAYELAQQRFRADDVRLNFYLTGGEFQSWDQVETEVAQQSRSHIYYGPSGHEIVYMETASGFTQSGIVREFRLPGTPGVNTLQNGPLLERSTVTEIVNTIQSRFDRDYINGGLRSEIRRTAADSVALFGERQDPRWAAGLDLWMHAAYEEHPSYLVSGVVSGILNFYVDREKFAKTRFSFNASFPTHGVERGSPVRVVYEVAPYAFDPFDRYRNVVAEVEEIRNNPLNGELHTLTVRAVELPSLGLPAITWADLFTLESHIWTDKIGETDTWADRWSIG